MAMLKEKKRFLNRGFTLIEVMVSLGIISTVLVVLIGLRNYDIEANGRARDITAATLLAGNRLAILSGFPDPGVSSGEFENTIFSWEEEIKPTMLEDIREVTVSILWKQNEESSESKRIEFTTFLIR